MYSCTTKRTPAALSAFVACVPCPATMVEHKTSGRQDTTGFIVGDMRVTFPRLPDREPAYAVVERDDGVVYRLYGGRAGRELPHDIRHLVVEKSMGITDGIWAAIAAGTTSAGTHGPREDMVESLAERVAALDEPSPQQVRALAACVLSPAVVPADYADPDAIIAAARALRVEAARWARLRTGESLSYDWPVAHRRPAIPG